MDNMLNDKSDEDLLRSLMAEIAKANNEINCAQTDLKKARGRISFLIMLTNKLIDRSGD